MLLKSKWVDFERFIHWLIWVLWPCSGTGFLPTSHVKVSGGRVADAFHVRRHALVLPLVCLLAVLNLQGTWVNDTIEQRHDGRGKTVTKREKRQRGDKISQLAENGHCSQTIFLMVSFSNCSCSFQKEPFIPAMLTQTAMTNQVPLKPQPPADKKRGC